jgi:hypothetical protein
MAKSLTPKQARFASLVAKGQTKTQAYRTAYEATGMKQSTIKVEAHKVSKLPHVAEAIDSYKRQDGPSKRVQEQLEADWVIERLMDMASREHYPPASRVRSLELLGKISGLFDDRVTVTTLRSPEELEEELIAKLKSSGIWTKMLEEPN